VSKAFEFFTMVLLFMSFLILLPAALHAAQGYRYLIYSEADFEVFRPAGVTHCTDGGEIWHGGGGMEEGTYGPLLST